MIAELNRLVEVIEDRLDDDLDVTALASALGTTEYHLRRMFSSLAGMPLSEYIRRRRMSVAAADILGDVYLHAAISVAAFLCMGSSRRSTHAHSCV